MKRPVALPETYHKLMALHGLTGFKLTYDQLFDCALDHNKIDTLEELTSLEKDTLRYELGQITIKVRNHLDDMNQEEINKIPDTVWRSIPSNEKRSCFDCGLLSAALNHYCTSPEARKARGTTLPGCIKCPYWEPRQKLQDVVNEALTEFKKGNEPPMSLRKLGQFIIIMAVLALIASVFTSIFN